METTVNANERRVEVCFSPALFSAYTQDTDCVIVVIDVFRATSAICTAFEHGIKRIFPVSTLEEAKAFQKQGCLAAAERNGEIVAGFDLGNSPLSYQHDRFVGKDLAITTTNGTKAIGVAKGSGKIIVGSFLNLKAVCEFLVKENKDVILLCAGWKDRFNLEDSLFAGAVVYHLKNEKQFTGLSDSSLAACSMYEQGKSDLNGYLKNSSHRNRLARLNLEEDIEYCLQESILPLVPVYHQNYLWLEGH